MTLYNSTAQNHLRSIVEATQCVDKPNLFVAFKISEKQLPSRFYTKEKGNIWGSSLKSMVTGILSIVTKSQQISYHTTTGLKGQFAWEKDIAEHRNSVK